MNIIGPNTNNVINNEIIIATIIRHIFGSIGPISHFTLIICLFNPKLTVVVLLFE